MNNQELVESGMDIMQSLCVAIQLAGGRIENIDLKHITAWELIGRLSTNNIKFVYVGDKQ